jgi:hypothetical protein
VRGGIVKGGPGSSRGIYQPGVTNRRRTKIGRTDRASPRASQSGHARLSAKLLKPTRTTTSGPQAHRSAERTEASPSRAPSRATALPVVFKRASPSVVPIALIPLPRATERGGVGEATSAVLEAFFEAEGEGGGGGCVRGTSTGGGRVGVIVDFEG